MSNLRRSRPDEQDDLLRRLQEISMTRHRPDSTDQSSPSPPRRQLCDRDSQSLGQLSPGAISPDQETHDSVFLPEAWPKLLTSPVSPRPRTILNLDFSRDNSPPGSDPEDSVPVPHRVHGCTAAQLQLSLSDDNKWEKLRSLLVAMKEEPFDVEESLKASSHLLATTPEKLSTQEELQIELAAVQDLLVDQRIQLRQTQGERDAALTYIHNLKVNGKDTLSPDQPGKEVIDLYKLGMDSLRSPNVSKDDVIELLLPLVSELHKQKSYLDRLLTVAAMRVPWILDEVDKMELPDCQTPLSSRDKNEQWR